MCAALISAGDAAWAEADAAWERLQVAAADALAADDHATAGARWAEALRLAQAAFDPDDPRVATSLVNQAVALARRGDAAADRLFVAALDVWDRAPGWLGRQPIMRRARSSIFHLRLEAKHRRAYDANLRRRAETLLRSARTATAALAAGATCQGPDRAAFQALGSARLDALRKVLASAYLMVAPAPDQDAQAQTPQDGS